MSIDRSFRIPNRRWENINLDFKMFAGKQDFFDQTDEALEYLKRFDKPKKMIPFYQPGFNYASHVEKHHFDDAKTFVDYEMYDVLERYLNAFEEIIATVDMGGAFKKSRIKITDDKRGIFTFALASKGLYRPQEYFSEELATESPFEFPQFPSGVVPAKKVDQVTVLGIKQFWYTSEITDKKYLLKKQDEGTRAIELKTPGAKLAYKTSNKKSYLMFEKKGGKAKMVELYFPIHASVKLNKIFPLILVARYLQSVGIKTRITVVRVYQEGYGQFVMWGYPIKDYDDELDFNNIALQGVDDRWWEAVRVAVRSQHDYEYAKKNGQLPSSLWYGAGSEPGTRADFVALFSRYRNWYIKEIKAGRFEPLRIDKKLMLMGGVYNIDNGADIRSKRYREMMIAEFFRIIDIVDFQFNKPEETCKRIYKRLVEDKIDEYYDKIKDEDPYNQSPESLIREMNHKRIELTSEYKIHVQELLTDTYIYPKGGEHPEEKEDAEKLEDEYDTKMEAMYQFLKTL